MRPVGDNLRHLSPGSTKFVFVAHVSGWCPLQCVSNLASGSPVIESLRPRIATEIHTENIQQSKKK
jgi:hypothetical protein